MSKGRSLKMEWIFVEFSRHAGWFHQNIHKPKFDELNKYQKSWVGKCMSF